MSKYSQTKDELYIIRVYDYAKKSGDLSNPIDRYSVGKRASLSPKGVNTICKLLLRANFIKVYKDQTISLTEQGRQLVERLLADRPNF